MKIRCTLSVLILLGLSGPVTRADDLPPVTLCGESRGTGARLAEAENLLRAKKYPDALTLLQSIIDTAGNDLVPVRPDHAVRARQLCHLQLSRLPPPVLESYRERIEAQAGRWLEGGRAGLDDNLLHKLVDEAFCSRAAATALDLLGDLAFERGRFSEAESWWHQLAPLDPATAKEGEGPASLVYPDPAPALVARVGAKQLLARLFRTAPGWEADLEAYGKRHGKAEGSLAGKKGPYVEVLRAVAADYPRAPVKREPTWPTFGGSPTRGRVVDPLPDPDAAAVPAQLARLCRGGTTWRFDLEERRLVDADPFDPGERKRREEERRRGEVGVARRLAFYPVVVWPHALVADARYVTAYDLRSGKAETWYDATEFNGGIRPNLTLPLPAGLEDLRYTLTVADGCVFARLGLQGVQDVRPREPRPGVLRGLVKDESTSILVCLSLEPRPGGDRRRWMVRAIDPGRKESAVFEGSPVVSEGRVAIAATRFEGDRVITAIHCYPADPEDSEPPLLWKTEVCETRELQPIREGKPAEAPTDGTVRRRMHLLTVAGNRLVYCSHSGAVVALDLRTGQRLWGMRYPRRDVREPEDAPQLRDLAPPVFAGGRLFVAPNDTDRLLCLDPETGEVVWERRGLDVVHLLGVGEGRLIFTTRNNSVAGRLQSGGLRAVLAATGLDEGGWSLPDDGGGLSPLGRGLLVGGMVLWPTARIPYGVFAVRQADGQQVDNPTLLHRIPSGNLVFAQGCLVVTGTRDLWAFVPPHLLIDEKEGATRAEPASARRWLELGLALADGGQQERAAEALARAEKAAQAMPAGQARRTRLDQVAQAQADLKRAQLLAAVRQHHAAEAEELYRKGIRGTARERLRTAVALAAAWEKAGERERALAVWRGVLADRELAQVSAEDLDGTPRRADQAAERAILALGDKPDGTTRPRPAPRGPRPIPTGNLVAGPTGDRDPAPRMPSILPTWEALLAPREHVLFGAGGEAVYTARPLAGGGEITCRSARDGRQRWTGRLAFVPTWAGVQGERVVVGGTDGAAALNTRDGTVVWVFVPPPVDPFPTGVGNPQGLREGLRLRVSREAGAADPLSGFQLSEGRLVCLLGQFRLLALDADTGKVLWHRWAPGGFLSAPGGGFNPLFYLDAGSLVVQVAGRRWTLDPATGTTRHQAPTPRAFWVRQPVVLDGRTLLLVPDERTVQRVDRGTGEVLWSWTVPGVTTRSCEAPLVLAGGDLVLVVIPENVGYRLQRLDLAGGTPLWASPPLLPVDRLEPAGWVLVSGVLYHVGRGRVWARSAETGKVLWDVALPGSLASGGWGLRWVGGLLAWPLEVSGVRFQFRWLGASLQWQGGPLLDGPRRLILLDGASGALRQQFSFEPARGETETRTAVSAFRVFPRLDEVWRGPTRALALRLGSVEKGLAVELGGRVWVVRPSSK